MCFKYGSNHALIAHVKHNQTSKQLIIVTIHTTGDPSQEDVKLHELAVLFGYLNYSQQAVKNFIFCGDFNSTPDSTLYSKVLSSPLNISSAYKVKCNQEPDFTINTGDICKTTDYIFYNSKELNVTKIKEISKNKNILLPNDSNPSDHYPLRAEFTFTNN